MQIKLLFFFDTCCDKGASGELASMCTAASVDGGASAGGYSASMVGVSLAASSIDDGFLAKKYSPRSPERKTGKDDRKQSSLAKTLSAWKKSRSVNTGWSRSILSRS